MSPKTQEDIHADCVAWLEDDPTNEVSFAEILVSVAILKPELAASLRRAFRVTEDHLIGMAAGSLKPPHDVQRRMVEWLRRQTAIAPEHALITVLAGRLLDAAVASGDAEVLHDGAWVHLSRCRGFCGFACGAIWIGFKVAPDGQRRITAVVLP